MQTHMGGSFSLGSVIPSMAFFQYIVNNKTLILDLMKKTKQ